MDQIYVLRHIFLFCDETCRDPVYRVCKLWRNQYKWVNPRKSYIQSSIYHNFKFCRVLFDCFGQEFADFKVLLQGCCHKELNCNALKILDFGFVDPSEDGNMAITQACRNGHLVVVNKLLKDARVDPSRHHTLKNIAIERASYNGHLDVVNRLLQDTRVTSNSLAGAIEWASFRGHTTILRHLMGLS